MNVVGDDECYNDDDNEQTTLTTTTTITAFFNGNNDYNDHKDNHHDVMQINRLTESVNHRLQGNARLTLVTFTESTIIQQAIVNGQSRYQHSMATNCNQQIMHPITQTVINILRVQQRLNNVNSVILNRFTKLGNSKLTNRKTEG